MGGVLQALKNKPSASYGFDVSWSRIQVGRQWLEELGQRAQLFVGDLMDIPMQAGSVDFVYSSHSLEPNGGREAAMIAECMRVARYAVVLVEPIYELADAAAQARMESHGYIRGLYDAAAQMGAAIVDYRLLDYCSNPLNPSGVLIIKKAQAVKVSDEEPGSMWQCPLTGSLLLPTQDGFHAPATGLVYPILRGVPLLRQEHAIVASRF
jgi:hypothetical protein